MLIYFIRLKMLKVIETAMKALSCTLRVEQLFCYGGPSKSEDGFEYPEEEHILLIVHAEHSGKETIEKLLRTGEQFGHVYSFECYEAKKR